VAGCEDGCAKTELDCCVKGWAGAGVAGAATCGTAVVAGMLGCCADPTGAAGKFDPRTCGVWVDVASCAEADPDG
jgi:hypothetical protein